MNALTDAIYNDENKAREHLESIRWPNGPECPHCGSLDNAKRLEGTAARPGLLNCRDCRKQFSVTVGTVFERSKIPLTKWLACSYLMASSKKGISSHQIHRTLGITYKSAWFMTHRLREAMRDDGVISLGVRSKNGEVHTIELLPEAQSQLVLVLLASSSDPTAPTSKRLRPAGLGRFQLGNDVGISLLVEPQIAFHVVLARPLASALQHLLATFDDPSTWTAKPKPN